VRTAEYDEKEALADARKREHIAIQSNFTAGVVARSNLGFYPLGATGERHGLNMPTEDPDRDANHFGPDDLPGDGEMGEVLKRTRNSGIDLEISAMRFYKCDCPNHVGAQKLNPFQVLCMPSSDFAGKV
jgi:hypothetical protein